MTRNKEISNGDRIIDSRDVIKRIAELQSQADEAMDAAAKVRERLEQIRVERIKIEADGSWDDLEGGALHYGELNDEAGSLEASIWKADDGLEFTDDFCEDDYEELGHLQALAEEGSGSPDWEYGETLINADYFVDYAQELAEDIGAVNRNLKWPLNHVDWDAAAEELKQDYSEISFDGTTYLIRD